MTSFQNGQHSYSMQVVQYVGQNMNNYYNGFASDVGSGMTTDSSNSS